MRIRLGTRGSRLARAQASTVGDLLQAAGHDIEYIIIKTSGDENSDRAYLEIGAPGIFVRQIEQALLDGKIDLAVHSYKDLPTRSPMKLVVAAVPERLDARDLLLVRKEAVADGVKDSARWGLPVAQKARVGTASSRRKALLNDLRPDLSVELIRGNVPTRLRKLEDGLFDAILLASAGVERLLNSIERDGTEPLPLDGIIRTPLDPEVFVPAPAQGAIAVQVRSDDTDMCRAAAHLDDTEARRTVRTERALLSRIEGGCSLPFGAWCRTRGTEGLELFSVLGIKSGLARAKGRGTDPDELADEVYNILRSHK